MDWIRTRWPEVLAIAVLVVAFGNSLALPLIVPDLSTARYAAAFNAALSIATGGLVSFSFYYIVNERLERRRRRLIQASLEKTYLEAKRRIAYAIIHASRRGGRLDLSPSSGTIDDALTVSGFRRLFDGGREGDEGFYAFENEMSYPNPEFEEIIFNLRTVARASERLIDNNAVDDEKTYDFIVRLSALIERIERNGAGYDESKLLCGFILQMFRGWDSIEGDLGYDPILRTIQSI
jgi:hypothetical protein